MTASYNHKLLCHLLLSITIYLLCQIHPHLAKSTEDSTDPEAPDICSMDENVSSVCSACSKLPFETGRLSAACCSDKKAFKFCEACIGDQESCYRVMEEIREFQEFEDDMNDNAEIVSDSTMEDTNENKQIGEQVLSPGGAVRRKRYGTLFMSSPKRYGRFWFGKRASERPDKRLGRLFFGSSDYPGKRWGPEDPVSTGSDMFDKRFGRLYMNTGPYFRRGDDEFDSDAESLEKRFGTLYLGSGSKFGKRFEGGDQKRFGTLHLGGNRNFGKRSGDAGTNYGEVNIHGDPIHAGESWMEEGADEDMQKRYGRLFTGKGGWPGKRSEPGADDDNMDRHFGRLFIGKDKYSGKRSSQADQTVDKRFGRLFIGG